MAKKYTLLLLAVLFLGVLVGVNIRTPDGLSRSDLQQPEQVERGAPVDNALDPIEASSLASIEAERMVPGAARQAAGEELRFKLIEKQLTELQLRLESLEQASRENPSSLRNNTQAEQGAAGSSQVSGHTGEAKLVEAGIDSSMAAWIQQQLDKNELDELYLKNQASREGWLNESRYHRARREIQGRINDLRDQVGDDDFDRLLYALGRPNRVLIHDVMQGSPAQQNGLNASDAIISYDGARVFSTAELQKLTNGGDPSSWVMVGIRRDGELLNIYVPGGPLGVRLTTARVMPR